jgi:hypothetical protein
MSSQFIVPHKTSPGRFYENSPTRDFRGMTEMMKQYVEHRGEWIDHTLLADAMLPETPVITPSKIADASTPTLKLHLASSNPAGMVKWRLAEITDTKKPAGKAKTPHKYEIEALWEAECGATAEVPTKNLEKGHTYRIRARIEDGNGHWSHWSSPAQFVR